MKEHNTIKISRAEYLELITCKERVKAVERIVAASGFITTSELLAVLDSKTEPKKVGEDVGEL